MKRTVMPEPINIGSNGNGTAVQDVPAVVKPKRGKVAAPASGPTTIIIPKLQIETAIITLVGDSPLISHKWSEKAKREMLDKQMGKAKGKKEPKNPWNDFLDTLYWITERPNEIAEGDFDPLREATFGFPTIAFKAAAVGACSHVSNITKVEARGAFHVNGELVEIEGTPEPREDMVRVGMGTADLRYRAEFKDWAAQVEVRYNKNVLSLEQIVNLFNTAGFAIGVGEWRPEKDGSYGMFHVQ